MAERHPDRLQTEDKKAEKLLGNTWATDTPRGKIERVASHLRGKFFHTTSGSSDDVEEATALDGRETKPSRLLSFAEVEAFLKKRGIDLGKGLEDDVPSMIHWGGLKSQDSGEYARAFEENFEPISEADLQALVRQLLELNPDLEQRVILGSVSLTQDQRSRKLFIEREIRHYIYRRLSESQRVDAATGQPLLDQRPTCIEKEFSLRQIISTYLAIDEAYRRIIN